MPKYWLAALLATLSLVARAADVPAKAIGRLGRRARMARAHAEREALDSLVVAGERGRSRTAHDASSRHSPRPASAASRSRLSTARAATKPATSISCRRSGWRCSSTPRAKARDSAWASTWPPARAGLSAVPRSARRDGSSSHRADRRQARRESPPQMKVKRPAPGGEGLVLDPYSPDALDRYLQRFTTALAALAARRASTPVPRFVRVLQRELVAALPAKFREINGYDIQSYAARARRREAAGRRHAGPHQGRLPPHAGALHLDYVNAWVHWSHAQGSLARNQAHGAPGNLLDLYAAADIPETESFGLTPLPIAGLRADAGRRQPRSGSAAQSHRAFRLLRGARRRARRWPRARR